MATDIQNHLKAETRTQFGKGFARRLRAAHQIPAVLYGHGSDPVHISVPGHETMLILRKANAVITLEIDGEQQLGLVKDVQRDPVTQIIEHIDFVIVKKGEKVTVDVPIVVTGEPEPGFIYLQDANTVSVEVEATHIPEHFEISVDGLEDGAQILASDVKLPSGATLVTEGETLLASVTTPQVEEEPEDEETEGDEAEGEAGDEAEGDAESTDGDDA